MNFTIPIVGAGPVGLTAALALAHHGIKSVVFDKRPTWEPIGSRAIVIDNGSLQHFQALGLVEEMIDNGLVASSRRTFFRTRELHRVDFTACKSTGLPRFLNLPQQLTEEILLRHAKKSPLITIKWGQEVKEVQQQSDSVLLQTNSDSIEAPYMVAADGCRSTLRRSCNLDFPGSTNPSRFMIVDVRTDLPHPGEHHFHFDHPSNRRGTLLLVPQPKNVWRVDWQLKPTDDHIRAQDPENMKKKIRVILGTDTSFELVWSSCYQFHQRLIPVMRQGGIFFAGDAAHLTNPFGGRNMNAGIQDAMCAVWRIAMVLKGKAHPSFICTYEKERGRANREHQKVTKKTMRFVAPKTAMQRWIRDRTLELSARYPKLRRWVNSGTMSPADTHSKMKIPEEYLIK